MTAASESIRVPSHALRPTTDVCPSPPHPPGRVQVNGRHVEVPAADLVGDYKPLHKFAAGPPPSISCSDSIRESNQVES